MTRPSFLVRGLGVNILDAVPQGGRYAAATAIAFTNGLPPVATFSLRGYLVGG